ncbi:MAG: outer membrane lipoprotein carrier protein LolA [Phycisphaerae bacterium]|nr:outer membrane lipoprotein carrier protein LolA [Phycisphaerae bacterium]
MTYALVVSLCLVNLACGEEKLNAKKDASQPEAKKADKPAAPVANPTDAPARAILDRLEKAGDAFTTLRTDIRYEVVNRMTGEKEQRTGWAAYQKETKDQPAKFRVNFQTLRLEEGPETRNQVDYVFDGRFVTKDQYNTKTRTQWQVAAEGEKIEPLKIGKGPFPVPFGQKTNDVLALLQARTRNPDPSDPPDTDYLKLTPLPGKEKDVNFNRLEMWISRKTDLPVKLIARDENENIKTVTFTNTKTDAKIDPKLFNVPKPAGFELIVQRLEQ